MIACFSRQRYYYCIASLAHQLNTSQFYTRTILLTFHLDTHLAFLRALMSFTASFT